MRETTHIICFPVNNQQIVDAMRKLQETIYTNAFYQKHDLRKAMVDLYSTHLLVANLCIRTDEEMEKVKHILDLYHDKISRLVQDGLVLTFQGLGLLNETELYMQVFNDDALRTLKDVSTTIRSALMASGVYVLPQKSFVGQITVFKYNEDQVARGLKIQDDLWMPLMYSQFGQQPVRCLQLCNIHDKPRWSYYRVEWQRSLEARQDKRA
ncbi:hypothetical protein BOX15_Mlig029747g3 [Macrostomum lignano]|uniref:A-kinase anchor protein 7-like phosphoesterase domain-containing protein n=2 Tax=Macrostomum lignano TaxID=282301 RepID=A0A267DZM1_9PLAT|nr:hypothetical protein BOX15_Mlig029747g3 [Macrostomum lignano]